MEKKYVLALDQGTTSSRAILFNRGGEIVASAQKEFRQIYPKPGWVEHDPLEIWATQSGVMTEVIERASVHPGMIAAMGITNQRETTMIWDRRTGEPIYHAIVWQSRQTVDECKRMKEQGLTDEVRARTGLLIDAYFSASKICWILDHVEGARARAERGELCCGTVDSWLVWKLTGGQTFITDCTNASRTMVYNIHDLCWDDTLLEALRIPRSMLPEVRSSSEVYASVPLGRCEIPLAGIAGDQHAALFGQACYSPGMVKNTYGTGAFVVMNTGKHAVPSESGLLTTIAWALGDQVEYALEGSVFVAGAVVQWLRDELGMIRDAHDTEYFAGKVEDTGGVYVVPAFTGLGAPHWDMQARGMITGITRGTNHDHLVRATLESIAYQSMDVMQVMMDESGRDLPELRVDGGACANNFLMQFQADLMNVPVSRPAVTETTALGAAYLAGLATGFWKDREEISRQWRCERTFEPSISAERREELRRGWAHAVRQCCSHE